MNKECIILAGGFGTRLQSVVNDVPKCMAQVASVPFLSHVFDYLEKENFDHIILSLGYKAEVVLKWIEGQQRGFSISYTIEDQPLGTGGAIKYAFSKAKTDKALVVNGDTFFNVNIKELVDFHNLKDADITIALKPLLDFDRYGTVTRNKENEITAFLEKEAMKEGLINGGVYLINKKVFERLDLPDQFSFEKDILEKELKNLNIYGLPFDNYFIDIGIPTDYEKANIDFINKNFK